MTKSSDLYGYTEYDALDKKDSFSKEMAQPRRFLLSVFLDVSYGRIQAQEKTEGGKRHG